MRFDLKKALAVAAAVAVGVLAWDTAAIFPLKLLAVLIHESGHALAVKLTGGTVESITIDTLEGGLCRFRSEPTFLNTVLIGSAGYLGSALAGALLLLVTLRLKAGRWVLAGLSFGLCIVTVLWARSLFTVGVALGMAVALGLAARYLPRDFAGALALFIGAFNSLYALFDLKDDLWGGAERRAGTDAAILAQVTHIPAIVWAVFWTLLGIALLVLALRAGTLSSKAAGQPAPRLSPRLPD